ncbi:MAG TPA: BamA/TamA family outer membrane protein [Chitinophagaceae bacterium]|nr:BamA/TamA family outer membrane protein [Chitinophagaceae bacterium]
MYRKLFMTNLRFLRRSAFVCFILIPFFGHSQYRVVAGSQYARSSFHQFIWGKHYRREWNTPVNLPGLLLDTMAGGLKPYQAGGGRQTRSLRLRDPNGKEYVMRSIDKTFGAALPPIYQHTFVESIINDQVTLGHPYSAVTIPLMAEAAGIYHTNPRIVYIPEQIALDSFNKKYANHSYLIEQRPDENWEEAANFGNSKNIVGTEKMLEKIFEDNDHRAEQVFYVRSRLFDFLIGDASRHEDQWRWASFKEGDKTIYKAIPRDRDQAYGKFDGFLIKLAAPGHLQTFDHKIPDINLNNFPSRNLDRQIANEPSSEQWLRQAGEIQKAVTDEVIENAVRQLPPEVFPISGPDIIAKLKSRRNDLHLYAKQYYLFLAREVEVVGSKEEEFFHVSRQQDGKVLVDVSKIKKSGEKEASPFYSRTFLPGETREIRLYGLAGNDVYQIDGEAEQSIKVRIIGGSDKDSIVDVSSVKSGRRSTLVYDDDQNSITTSNETRLFLSNDSAVHHFKYDAFKYDDKGLKPILFYSFEDKLYVGLGYKILKHGWRKEPFSSQQQIQVNYSLMQHKPSFIYEGDFMQVAGKWNLGIDGNYDLMRWTNFAGLGNDTKQDNSSTNYYQLQSKVLLATLDLNRPLGKHGRFGIGPVYHMVRILENKERFFFHSLDGSPKSYVPNHFGGAQAYISFAHLDDPVVPTTGISFSAGAKYLKNLKEPGKEITRYDADMQVYLPLFTKHLVLAIHPAAATVTGHPEFYQHVSIAGSRSLRGFPRDRFWGTSSFYSANELQYLFDARTRLFNGKMGIIGFYDVGRVWLKNEFSDTWHKGYGGGLLIAPFNKFMATILYGHSIEGDQIHIRVSKGLK